MNDYLNLLRDILKKAELRNDKEEMDLIKSEITIIECDKMLDTMQHIAKSKKRTTI